MSNPLADLNSSILAPWSWAQKRLFNSWYNIVLTIAALLAIAFLVKTLFFWATTQAQWAVINHNLRLFLVGYFPKSALWRLWVILGMVTLLLGLTWGKRQTSQPWRYSSVAIAGGIAVVIAIIPISLAASLRAGGVGLLFLLGAGLGRSLSTHSTQLNRWLAVGWILSLPLIFWLLRGGFGLPEVPVTAWSGLLLTLLAAGSSIALSFPLGILLALGRQSPLPIVRLFSTVYIELLRGLPLIGVLFMALIVLPLLLPPDWTEPDPLLRGLAGLILFSAAYMAEVVRGGLQATPRGQVEAARALGLNPLLVVGLVLLPQALRTVIPALVGEFISLFKETALLSVFGLIELLGISASILANPDYLGRYAEVYLFVGIVYWMFCYTLTVASRRLETNLGLRQS